MPGTTDRFLVLHITDIHATADMEDRLLLIGEKIAATLTGSFERVEHVAIVLSGDLSYSGKSEQFEAFAMLLLSLESGISSAWPGCGVQVIAVPGNHDLDFDEVETNFRDLLLNQPASKIDATEEGKVALLSPQKAFWQHFGGSPLPLVEIGFPAGKPMISFVCINTSMWSSKTERPQLKILPSVIDRIAAGDGSQLGVPRVAVMHHPTDWFEHEDEKNLKNALLAGCSLALVGHEHRNSRVSMRNLDSGDGVTELLAPPLIDHKNRTRSFQVVDIHRDRNGDLVGSTQLFQAVGSREECLGAPPFADADALPVSFALNANSHNTTPSSETIHRMSELELPIALSGFNMLKLDDIYVDPFVVVIVGDSDTGKSRGARIRFSQLLKETSVVTVVAGQWEGKSTMARHSYIEASRRGQVPVLLNGSDFRDSKFNSIQAAIESAFVRQYGTHDSSSWTSTSHDRRCIVVDDLHLAPKDVLGRFDELASHLRGLAYHIFFFTSDEILLKEPVLPRLSAGLSTTTQVQLLHFNRRTTTELALRYADFRARSEGIDWEDPNRAVGLVDDLVGRIEAAGLLPFAPYLLAYMHAVCENDESQADRVTKGVVYGPAVTLQLNRQFAAGEAIRIESLLESCAERMLDEGRYAITFDGFAEVHKQLVTRLSVTCNLDADLEGLMLARVLRRTGDNIHFVHRYGALYFIARGIARNLRAERSRAQGLRNVRQLLSAMHREDCATAIMFLCQLDAGELVLEELVDQSKRVFAGSHVLKIASRNPFLDRMTASLPALELSDCSPADFRIEASDSPSVVAADEEREQWIRESAVTARLDSEPLQDHNLLDQVVATVRIIQTCGEICRLFYGKLDGDAKRAALASSVDVALRCLGRLFSELESHEDETVVAFAEILARADEGGRYHGRSDLLRRDAGSLLRVMTSGSATGVMVRLAKAFGTKDLQPVWDVLAGPATDESGEIDFAPALVRLALQVWSTGKLHVERFRDLEKQLRDTPFGREVLRQFAVERMTRFTHDRTDKASLCQMLNIKLPSTAQDPLIKANR